MMKRRVAFVMVTAGALLCLAAAQNSKPVVSSATAGPDPLKTAIKPLTPKSAIASPHKSSAAAPAVSTSSRKTSAELTQLERQRIKVSGSSNGSTGASKAAPKKPATTSSQSGSGINATYQKPHVPQK